MTSQFFRSFENILNMNMNLIKTPHEFTPIIKTSQHETIIPITKHTERRAWAGSSVIEELNI